MGARSRVRLKARLGPRLRARLTAVFKATFDGLFAFLFSGLLFLAEGFFDRAVAFLIIEFVEIVGFAFAQAGSLPGGGILFHARLVCCFTTVVNRKDTIKARQNGEELGRSSAEAAASLPGAPAGAAGAVVGHLLKFCVLVRRQHRFEGVVAGRHEGFHLRSFLLGQEIVVFMDSLCLAAKVLLAGFEFGYLVIGETEGLAEPFESGGGHELGSVFAKAAAGGLLVFLQRGHKGLQFGLLFLLEGDETGLILL